MVSEAKPVAASKEVGVLVKFTQDLLSSEAGDARDVTEEMLLATWLLVSTPRREVLTTREE